jgi:hypothetical protein
VITAGLDRHEVATNYQLLQIWDLLSLYICSNEVLKDHMIAPVPCAYANAPDTVSMHLKPLSPERVAVDPFPFDRPALEIALVYRRLQPEDTRDVDAFRAAYFGAQPQIAAFTLIDPQSAAH